MKILLTGFEPFESSPINPSEQIIRALEDDSIPGVQLESSETPNGIGEPPIGSIAAAVANAVFALTGQRLRQLPLKLV